MHHPIWVVTTVTVDQTVPEIDEGTLQEALLSAVAIVAPYDEARLFQDDDPDEWIETTPAPRLSYDYWRAGGDWYGSIAGQKYRESDCRPNFCDIASNSAIGKDVLSRLARVSLPYGIISPDGYHYVLGDNPDTSEVQYLSDVLWRYSDHVVVAMDWHC